MSEHVTQKRRANPAHLWHAWCSCAWRNAALTKHPNRAITQHLTQMGVQS